MVKSKSVDMSGEENTINDRRNPPVHRFDKPTHVNPGYESDKEGQGRYDLVQQANQSASVSPTDPVNSDEFSQSGINVDDRNNSNSTTPPAGATVNLLHPAPNSSTNQSVSGMVNVNNTGFQPSPLLPNEPPPAYSEIAGEGYFPIQRTGEPQVYTLPTNPAYLPYSHQQNPPTYPGGPPTTVIPHPAQPSQYPACTQPQSIPPNAYSEDFYIRVMTRALGHHQPFESLSNFRKKQIRRIVHRQKCPKCGAYGAFILENSKSYSVMVTLMCIALIAVFLLLIVGAVFGGRISFFFCIGGRRGNCMTRHKIRRCKYCNYVSSTTKHWVLSGIFAFIIAAEIAAVIGIIIAFTS